MSPPSSESLLLCAILLQQTSWILAFPAAESAATGTNHSADTTLSKQCLLNPMLPECHTTLTTTPPPASEMAQDDASSLFSSSAPVSEESNWTSENEITAVWATPVPSEPHILVEIAQRSLPGRFALLLYRAIVSSDILTRIESVARRKKNDWSMLATGLAIGGTVLTAGLVALAAMSGKALMSSMLALGMSLMAALRSTPSRRCRRSVGTGRDDNCGGSSKYELIARPVVTHTHAHSAALQLDQSYPGYVRSFLDVPQDSNGAAAAPAMAPAVSAPDVASDAAWINYRTHSDANSGKASKNWGLNAVGMRSPSRSVNSTTEYTSWGPKPPSIDDDVTGMASNVNSFVSQPRKVASTAGYTTGNKVHTE